MQRQCICTLLLLLVLSSFLFPIDASGQNNAVRWSTFDMGFAVPSSSNTRVKSAVGQSFVGTSRSVNNWIDSGFLADTLLRGPVTAVRGDERTGIPSTYELSQNFPNPFNPSTKIQFALPRESVVKLVVYNILGQEVIRLVDEVRSAGYHTVEWNGENTSGSRVSSGVYFFRIETKDVAGQVPFTSVKRMMFLK